MLAQIMEHTVSNQFQYNLTRFAKEALIMVLSLSIYTDEQIIELITKYKEYYFLEEKIKNLQNPIRYMIIVGMLSNIKGLLDNRKKYNNDIYKNVRRCCFCNDAKFKEFVLMPCSHVICINCFVKVTKNVCKVCRMKFYVFMELSHNDLIGNVYNAGKKNTRMRALFCAYT
jgi:hypothetical protein